MRSRDHLGPAGNDADLEPFFDAARSGAPAPPDANFLARLEADALRAMPPAQGKVPGRVPRPGLLASLVEAIGGWPALGAMTAAGVAGLWIGIAPPTVLEPLETRIWGDSVSVTPYSEAALLAMEYAP